MAADEASYQPTACWYSNSAASYGPQLLAWPVTRSQRRSITKSTKPTSRRRSTSSAPPGRRSSSLGLPFNANAADNQNSRRSERRANCLCRQRQTLSWPMSMPARPLMANVGLHVERSLPAGRALHRALRHERRQVTVTVRQAVTCRQPARRPSRVTSRICNVYSSGAYRFAAAMLGSSPSTRDFIEDRLVTDCAHSGEQGRSTGCPTEGGPLSLVGRTLVLEERASCWPGPDRWGPLEAEGAAVGGDELGHPSRVGEPSMPTFG